MLHEVIILLNIFTGILLCDGQTTENEVTSLPPETTPYDHENATDSHQIHSGIHLIAWRWDEIGVIYTLCLFILITGLSKVVFHYAQWLSSRVPESCLLIVIGVIVGAILLVAGISDDLQQDAVKAPRFSPKLFFLGLLPPVVLEAAYSLYNASFFENLFSILLFAVVGTIFNTFSIGGLLYALGSCGLMGPITFGKENIISLVECLVFSSLISAVDPVAVLAIFQEVGVNKDLYFLVFGESLLNDAITVVLYTTMVTFLHMPTIGGEQYILAVLSFFTVNLGGMVVGIFFGLLTALLTKATGAVRVVEPLAVLGIAYLSYLSAELFHFSGIISIIFCGLVQCHYAFKNISHKSYVTVKYFTKMSSATSEAIIFLFLGTVLVSAPHQWHTGFALWTLLLCLICRFIGVFLLTSFTNAFNVRKIGVQEQFIMAYGGLRGAVGFSLVLMLDQDLKSRQVFVTTTLAVVLFTVFIQGTSIKPLVKLLNIEVQKASHVSLIGEINSQVTGHLMAGIEEIIGFKGNYYFKRKIQDIDEKYLQKIFYKSHFENKIMHAYEKWSLSQHYAHLYGPITLVEDKTAEALNKNYKESDLIIPPVIPSIPEEGPCEEMPRRRSLRKRISGLFPGVEIRKHEDETVANKEVLRRAFLSNPYNMYHYRYNRNLINDDAQEMNSQLKLRHERTRQISHLATIAASPEIPSQALQDMSPRISENFTSARKKIISEIEPSTPYEMGGINNILYRAQRRRTVHLSSTDEDLRIIQEREKAGKSQEPKEETSKSQIFPRKESENELKKDMIPLLPVKDEEKSPSSDEESPV